MKTGKPIIGIAGGVGSGKSTLASILGELGARVIASDEINQEELNSPEVRESLRRLWGDVVIGPDGNADRDTIRGIVTEDPQARKQLEGLVHPRIARRHEDLTARYQADPEVLAIVWDVPLLYEVGLANQCDCVIFVDTDKGKRLARVCHDRGWSAKELDQFEKTQKPLDFKRASADYRVDNNSDLGDLRRQVEVVFSRILSGA